MQEFAKHPSIKKMLVINRPISYSEIFYFKRNKFVKNGDTVYENKRMRISKVAPKVFVLDVIIPQIFLPFVMRRNWTSYAFGKDSFYEKVLISLQYLDMQSEYVLFSSAPIFVPLIKKLSPKVFVFDAQDNLLKSVYYSKVANLEENYKYCKENADLIYANSPETATWLSSEINESKFVSNGVDKEMFTDKNNYQQPDDLLNIPTPIVGYAGKMQEIFDVDLVENALKTFPDVNFVFIGQLLNPKWVRKLWDYPNAHYLGDKIYNQLPAYLHYFDICIVPISQERQHGGDPIKIYEYIAAGKPVVSTNTGGAEKLTAYSQVKITNTRKDFISALGNFLTLINENKKIEIEEISEKYTWKYKVDHFINDMTSKLRSEHAKF